MDQVVEWLGHIIEAMRGGAFGDADTWSYILLGLLVATEGPLSTLIGAAAAAGGYLDVRWVFIATMIGNIVGDVVWYYVGYFGFSERLLRYGRWLGLRPSHLARLERAMHNHASKLIVFAKVAYGLIVPTLVAAGMARVPWRRWFPVVFVVETTWSFLLVWLGFHAAWMIGDFERGLRILGLVVLAGGIVLIMVVMRRRMGETTLELDPLSQVLLREEDPLPGKGGVRPQVTLPPAPNPTSNGTPSAEQPVKEPEPPRL